MEEGAQFTGLERKSQLNTTCNQQREVIFCKHASFQAQTRKLLEETTCKFSFTVDFSNVLFSTLFNLLGMLFSTDFFFHKVGSFT
jgi:hypothetical protein